MKLAKGVKSVNREVVRLALSVPATTANELTFTVPGDCTIEGASLRIYEGAALLLQIKPYIKRCRAGGILEPLIRYAKGGKEYLDGDDDLYNWRLSIPAVVDDEIVIKYNNTDAAIHDFAFDIELDYAGGRFRMMEVVK